MAAEACPLGPKPRSLSVHQSLLMSTQWGIPPPKPEMGTGEGSV